MAVDTLLNNRYAIDEVNLEPLGKGGMAVIYAGTDTDSGDAIAAKTLLPEFQGDAARRKRFRREAEVLKEAQHEHVVRLIEIIDGRRGTWLIMEQLQGETLREKLDNQGPFKPRDISKWLIQVSEALEHMHQIGYVHLDITPQNLFLTDDGTIKLIDFGIAQKAWTVPHREGDKLLGTAAYISPEHGAGHTVSPASDIYSLGCVAFELLTGKKVFSERGQLSNDAMVSARQNAMPALPSSVSPELDLPDWVDDVVGGSLQVQPGDRYSSITTFAQIFQNHANPPFLRISWPRRGHTEDAVTRQEPLAAESSVSAKSRGAQSWKPHWLQRELRNARRTLVVFAMMLAMLFAAPAIGGSSIADWVVGFMPGSTTHVIDGNWVVRANPGVESESVTVLQQSHSVHVTGLPARVATDLWWPISTTQAGSSIVGWIHDSGLERTWSMNRAAEWTSISTTISDTWRRMTSFFPGQ